MDINTNALVKKSNMLINARYKLNINEQKILYMLISQIQLNDKDFKDYEIRTADLIEFIGTKSKTIYQDIEQYTYNLLKEVLIIETEGIKIQTNWFSVVKHINKHKILFNFHPVLKPHLLNLKECFTRFKLENIRNFKSKYAPRLYEYLKQYETIGHRTIDIEELRKKFLLGNLYKKYNDFKKYVLLKAQAEINDNTDICIEFVEIKEERKFAAIKFCIKPKRINITKEVPIEYENKQMSLVDLSNEKVIELNSKIRSVINDYVKESKIIEWIKNEKEEDINFYLSNWSRWNYKHKETMAGFFIFLVDKKIPLPKGEKGFYKPPQALNYEQRKYDDEFFDSIWDNYQYLSDEEKERIK